MRSRTLPLVVPFMALALVACEPRSTTPAGGDDAARASDVTQPTAATHSPTAAAAQPTLEATVQPTSEDAATEPRGDGDAGALGELVASVNGEPILLAEYQRQAFDTQRYFVERGLDPNTEQGQRELRALRRQVLEDMINQQLIEQADAELGIAVSDADVNASLESYVNELGGTEAFDESLRDAGTTREAVWDMERASMIGQQVLEKVAGDVPTTAEFVHARHILCETEAACWDAVARLAAGESFESIARDVSVDASSAERGGDLDWVGRGMLPSQQVEEAIFSLQPGERSSVVRTDFGYHIIEVLERDPQHPLTDEQRFQLQEKRLLDWLADQRATADVVIYIEDLKAPTDG